MPNDNLQVGSTEIRHLKIRGDASKLHDYATHFSQQAKIEEVISDGSEGLYEVLFTQETRNVPDFPEGISAEAMGEVRHYAKITGHFAGYSVDKERLENTIRQFNVSHSMEGHTDDAPPGKPYKQGTYNVDVNVTGLSLDVAHCYKALTQDTPEGFTLKGLTFK